MNKFKNSQKRFQNIDNNTYLITTVTHKRYPYFKNEILCELFIEELKIAKKLKKFDLYTFCILYDHVHILIRPAGEFNISEIMHYIKRHFSRNANVILKNRSQRLEGEDGHPRLPADKAKLIKRLDNEVQRMRNEYQSKKNTLNPPLKFQWQKSFNDQTIRTEEHFEKAMSYVAYNFQKHMEDYKYPVDYRFTSVNYIELLDLSRL